MGKYTKTEERTSSFILMCKSSGAKTMPAEHCNLARCCTRESESSDAACEARSFGEFLFLARRRQALSLRQLAEKSAMTASLLSEFENARRLPPGMPLVSKLAQALDLTSKDAQVFTTRALQERGGIGLRVARSTPRHVADLLRDIACMGQQLSPAQVRSIRQTLEGAMK